MASATPTFQRVDNPASFADSILTRVRTSVELFQNFIAVLAFLPSVSFPIKVLKYYKSVYINT
jgi:hypothetical protein